MMATPTRGIFPLVPVRVTSLLLLLTSFTVLLSSLSSTFVTALSLDRLPRYKLQDLAAALDISENDEKKGAMKRAETNVGYLGVFFLGADPYVYFYLSDGNNPVSFKPLNKRSPIVRPTKGTGGVRDPTIIPGGGKEAGNKWYIIGTDLHIGKVS